MTRTDGAAVECPTCGAKFGGMIECPWDGAKLVPLPDADPTAVAFYTAIDSYPEPVTAAPCTCLHYNRVGKLPKECPVHGRRPSSDRSDP